EARLPRKIRSRATSTHFLKLREGREHSERASSARSTSRLVSGPMPAPSLRRCRRSDCPNRRPPRMRQFCPWVVWFTASGGVWGSFFIWGNRNGACLDSYFGFRLPERNCFRAGRLFIHVSGNHNEERHYDRQSQLAIHDGHHRVLRLIRKIEFTHR